MRKARVKGDWLVRSAGRHHHREAMAIGTAGYTAMLSVMALERAGIMPARGSMVVTGAAGGVGSVAIALLAKLGYAVVASSGRASRGRLSQGPRRRRDHRPRGARRRAAGARQGALGRRHRRRGLHHAGQCAVDDPLWRRGRRLWTRRAAWTCRPRSRRSSCAALSLIGIDSVMCPLPLRQEAWRRLEADLDRGKIAAMTS